MSFRIIYPLGNTVAVTVLNGRNRREGETEIEQAERVSRSLVRQAFDAQGRLLFRDKDGNTVAVAREDIDINTGYGEMIEEPVPVEDCTIIPESALPVEDGRKLFRLAWKRTPAGTIEVDLARAKILSKRRRPASEHAAIDAAPTVEALDRLINLPRP